MNLKTSLVFILSILFLALAACSGGGGGGSSSNSGGGSSSSSSTGGTGGSSYTKENLTLFLGAELASAYADMNDQFSSLNTSITDYCQNTSDAAAFESIKTAWLTANSSWQYVSTINFGPVNEESRRYRISFYTSIDHDRLEGRIVSLVEGSEVISAETMAQRSADLQGLLALENILFKDNAFELVTVDDDVDRYCLLLTSISQNLLNMAGTVSIEWQNSGDYYSTFTTSSNVVTALEDAFGSVVEGLQILKDVKLVQVTTGSRNSIESSYAKVSLDNIRKNILFIEDIFNAGQTDGISYMLLQNNGAAVDTEFRSRLATLNQSLSAINESLSDLSETEAGIAQIENLANDVQQVLEYFAVDLAEHLDVYIGFNGADGD